MSYAATLATPAPPWRRATSVGAQAMSYAATLTTPTAGREGQRRIGSNSATHSTWCVMGKRSKERIAVSA